MKASKSNLEKPNGFSKGFALVVSLSMMVLLTIIAVGLLSLSSVTLRTTSQTAAMAEAQANARLALMIAIGELQKQMGPDQRISANSAILSESTVANAHWTGVWDSWRAGPSSEEGGYPSEPSDHQTIPGSDTLRDGMHPTYAVNRSDHFRRWLVSLSDPESAENINLPTDSMGGNVMPGPGADAVQLVAEGSLGPNRPDDVVNVGLIDVTGQNGTKSGRYGWWVGDESQKARIMADSYETDPSSLTNADRIFRSQAPGSMGTSSILGLEGVTEQEPLAKLPSLGTLDLVSDVSGRPSQINFFHATLYSHGVLADVREGGLKRDLSTLLEREIRLTENDDEFMLYRFDTHVDDRVPLQDLSAYYQLYHNDPDWTSGKRGGIEHNADASRVMQVRVPNYGSPSDRNRFLREYTALYRNPVPIRVQFVLGVGAKEITDEERAALAARPTPVVLRDSDKYRMLLGVRPVVTLWNPTNVPMVMGTDASQQMRVGFPPFNLRWRKHRATGAPAQYETPHMNLNYLISNESTHSGGGWARSLGPYIMQLRFAQANPVIFEPGEAKMFSIPINAANFLESAGDSILGNTTVFQATEFLPDGFYVTAKTAAPSGVDVVQFPNSSGTFVANQGFCMVFGDDDRIDFEVVPEAGPPSPRGRSVSNANEIRGSGFQFWMAPASYVGNSTTAHFRNYQFISRFGGTDNPAGAPNFPFNAGLMLAGFPGGQPIPYQGFSEAIEGSEILAATDRGEAMGLLHFTMMAGAEAHTSTSPGIGAGRRITSRPFLHGSTLSAPQITDNTRAALYDYGWEWQVERVNDLEEAFQDDGDHRGYHGGGYTVNSGVTHVVQQYLPALPSISIASLSNARLGGFSLANAPVMAGATDDIQVGGPASTGTLRDAPNPGDFRQVTATGQGGLAPHTLQAIGNSYAHPNIPAARAFTTYTQFLNTDTDDTANPPQRTYADHSYLANKALWDEFFFSSIAPRPAAATNPLYGPGGAKLAEEVANDFLFNDESLPNRRFLPYTANLSPSAFEVLEAQYATYSEGFADKIASHMMVAGPFNINSTSVDAWRGLFSSLKGKPLAFLEDNASRLSTITPDNILAAPGMLANGEPIDSSQLTGRNVPPDQWTSSRGIRDEEIDQLAEAMVRQVKLRGPFLSLSEFINRRLDGDNLDFALKGALQAALDDDSVTINAAFRTAARSFNLGGSTETGGMTTAFTRALEGPIAYGSTPYVDQADILRHMDSVLTPRGDTFVIRTYGDSLDRQGNVVARAWCEAVVQRIPDYNDSANQPHEKQSALTSINQTFGRKFQIFSFRWLNSSEI